MGYSNLGRGALSAVALLALILAGCRADPPKNTVAKAAARKEKKEWPQPEAAISKDFSSGILNQKKLIKAIKEIDRKKYPNADEVLVDDYILCEYKPDGTSVTWDDTCLKILTEKGRQNNRSLSFYYSLPYSTVTLKFVEVVKHDGRVVKVDVAKNAKIMINSYQMSQNIYNPNDKILQVNIPDLEIGDSIRYLSFRKTVKARVPNTWSDYFLLEGTSPIKHLAIEIVSPDELPLAKRTVKNGGKGAVSYKVDKLKHSTVHRWDVSNVPRLFPEPNMPPIPSVAQRLLVSTIKSWKDVSSWYWMLSEPHIKAVSQGMRAKVEELVTKAGPSADKRMRAIFNFVSQRVRYIGLTTETNAPGYEPHDAKDTFAKMGGVCRDKAALLVAMLRLAGFDAYPVLIMVGAKKDSEVPNPYFNHAIACVEAPDNSTILMDPTNENSKSLLPSYLCDKSYLVAKPAGAPLRVSPVVPVKNNLLKINTFASINESGVMIAETSFSFFGINDTIYRGYFARIKPQQRRRFFERMVKNVVPDAKLVGYSVQPTNVRDTSKALKVYIRFVANDALVKGDGRVVLTPPWFGSSMGMANLVLGSMGLNKRRFPLLTDTTCGVVEHFAIDMGHAVEGVAAIPTSAPLPGNYVSWDQNFKFKNGVFEGNSEFLLKKTEFPPTRYLALKKAIRVMEYSRRKSPIFLRKGGRMADRDANSVVLNEKIHCAVDGPSSWTTTTTVKRKILTYAGQKKYSELKFHYNPAWDEVRVLGAKVISPNGVVKKAAKEDVNIMDEPWVGTAPRYSPGKILVVNLPGVAVGSIIEYKVVKKRKHRPFFSMTRYFRGFDPQNRLALDIVVPDKMRLEISNKEGAGERLFKFSVSEDGRKFSWKSGPAAALRYEPGAPPLWSFVPSCVVSSGKWSDYAKMIRKTVERNTAGQNQAAVKAVALTASLGDSPTEAEEVKAIRDFVARNIKLAGPGLGSFPLSMATPADKTLADGYGNSLDRAILLSAMLKAVGYKPEIILAADFPRIDALNRVDNVPQLGVFNKVLVKVPVESKGNVYLNDTSQYARLGATPSTGNAALFCGVGRIGKIEIPESDHSSTNIAYNMKIYSDGRAVMKVKRTFRGVNYGYWHKAYSQMTGEERDRHFQELVADISQSAKPIGHLETDFSSYPGVETFSVEVPRFAVIENNYLYLKLPHTIGNVLGYYGDTRETPLLVRKSRRTSKTYILTFPDKYAKKIPIAPQTNSWGLPCGAGRVSIVNDRDLFGPSPKPVMFIQQEMALNPAFISPGEFEMAKIVSEKMTSRRTSTLLLERTEDRIASFEE